MRKFFKVVVHKLRDKLSRTCPVCEIRPKKVGEVMCDVCKFREEMANVHNG
jgi:uncharacterized Zn finger protein (UPF0148 family)